MKSVKNGKLLSIIVSILISLVLSSCASDNKAGNVKVRIGLFANITHSQALLGKADGTFQKALGESVSIDWKVFNAGPSEIEALFAGELDIGYIGPGPALNGYVKSNGDLKIIAGATDAGAVLVSRKELTIGDVSGLQGKKVAVPQFGNTQDIILRHLMKQKDLKDTSKGGDVDVRQAQNADIMTLLGNGDIDAALVPEPWGSLLVMEAGASIVLDYDQVWREGKYTSAVVIARTDFIKRHPDIVESFLKAHVELTQNLAGNPFDSMGAVNEQIGELTNKPIGEEVLQSAFGRMTPTYDPEKESVAEMADLMTEIGYLKIKPDVSEVFDLTILNKVLNGKGLPEIE